MTAQPAPAPATAPIVKTLTVPLDPDRAFRLFTEEMSDWWPLETHSITARTGKPAARVTVTPRPGGTVVETAPDGTTHPWGRVTDWRPGTAFGMTWHVGRDPAQASQVDVSFEAVADGTRVTLIHSNWQALGEQAAAIRADYNAGWTSVLGTCFAKACRARMTMA